MIAIAPYKGHKRIKCRNSCFSEKQYFVQRNVGTPTLKKRGFLRLLSQTYKNRDAVRR
ncbi:hypothetical protein G436_3377 [Leptospira interrogans serovar Hardjo str. Norma]|uniref:Uncharacterized protein n=1 Tax=Leptospira interrogans serovar Hardjo str. Norma TaxID=1279460 RepID=A0A0M4NAP2_LEPIR|nr:hypothetical protein G436_3377 [Leptospira interrogans serovar Hardjo str. Norma]